MSVKAHYDTHLANFYAWMSGDINKKSSSFQQFLQEQNIYPQSTKVAIDLGAGHGIQSFALKNMSFRVTAIDFSQTLLEELKAHPNGDSIETIEEDITKVGKYGSIKPELICCCGDTLTHLENRKVVAQLLEDCADILVKNGKIILSFRDYTHAKVDEQIIIPVKSERDQILTCILNYKNDKVKVTDLLHQYDGQSWTQKTSSYYKTILNPTTICEVLSNEGFEIVYNKQKNGMCTIVGCK